MLASGENRHLAVSAGPEQLEERIQQDKRNSCVLITEMSRSIIRTRILRLLDCEVITADDLDGFSDELRENLCRGVSNRAYQASQSIIESMKMHLPVAPIWERRANAINFRFSPE